MRNKIVFSTILLTMLLAFAPLFSQSPVTLSMIEGEWNSAGLQPGSWSGMGLPPINGRWYFYDPDSGSSTNSGYSRNNALKTFAQALAKVVSGRGDGIVAMSGGSTSAATTDYQTAQLDINKNGVTVVGLAAPVSKFGRARPANNSSYRMDYLVKISGSNIAIYNMDFYNTPDSSASPHGSVQITGQRVYLQNCYIAAVPGSATANCWDLYLNGSQDFDMVGGSIGADTWDRGNNASGLILVNGQVYRSTFSGIDTYTYITTGTAAGVLKVASGASLNGKIIFKNECGFFAHLINSTKPALASWFLGSQPATGMIVLSPTCFNVGYAAWDATGGNDRVYVTAPVPTAATSGIGVAP